MQAALRQLVAHYAKEFQDADLLDVLPSGGKPLVEIHDDGLRCVVSRFPEGLVELTPREREIAFLSSEALPSKAIARRLGIKPPTVAAHLRRIYEKCGVDSRTGLATLMIGRS
jgi:DNA-binding CsgD family transcriptional regulator